MKRILCWILTLALACGTALPVLADEELPAAGEPAAQSQQDTTPAATPTDILEGNARVVSYGVGGFDGASIKRGASFQLSVKVADAAAKSLNSASQISAVVDCASFACGQSAAVQNFNQSAGTYTLVFDKVVFQESAGDKTMNIILSYPDSTVSMQSLSLTVSQCDTSVAEQPTATPVPPAGEGVYVVASTVTDRAGGEVSTVEPGDVVNVVLKVVDHSSARLAVEAGDIVTRVNSSVFTYTGIGEISQLYSDTDDGGAYYGYVLLFRDVIYNGGGNTFPVDLSYLDSSKPMQQFSVTLGQCLDKDPRTSNLVIRESSYGTEAITAGTPFTLSLTVYATSGDETINDVIVSLTLPEGITLTGGSLSTYVGSMGPQSTKQVSFPILPSAAFTAGVANIGVTISGTGSETGAQASSTGTTISVPVLQPDRFELGQLTLEPMMVGMGGSVGLSFVNKGKNAISNLEATLSGTNLGAETTQQYIGNLNPGTEGSVDFDLNPEAGGAVTGTITLTYESVDGQIKTVTKDFSTTAEEMSMPDDMGVMDPGMDMMEPEPTGLPVWAYVLIAAGVAAVIAAAVVVLRRRKKAKKLAELEDDGDEDL